MFLIQTATTHKRLFQKLVFSLTACLFFIAAPAQSSELQVTIQIKVVELGIKNQERKTDPVFKFFIGNENGTMLNKNGECYTFWSKEENNAVTIPDPRFPKLVQELQTFQLPILSKPTFDFVMECYADNRGEKCTLDKKDEMHSVTKKVIDLNSISPGDFSDTILIADLQPLDNLNHFYAKIQIRYNLVSPDAIKPVVANQSVFAADKPFQLNSGFQFTNKDRLTFTWEKSLDNGNSWSRLPVQKPNLLSITINPIEDLFGGKIETAQPAGFRLRVNSKDTFAVSEIFETSFTPAPPAFSKEDIVVTQSCRGYTDGGIILNKIKGVTSKIAYVLRKAGYEKETCNLANPSQANCMGFIKSGTAANSSIIIKDLAAGKYLLMVYNGGTEVGNVYTGYDFTVTSYDELTLANPSFKNPNCINIAGGEISIDALGGSTAKDLWSVVLTPSTGQMAWKNQQNPISFTGLEQGEYTLVITDGCGEGKSKIFTLTQPEKLKVAKITFIKASSELSIKMKNGSGNYRLTISDADQAKRIFDSSNLLVPIRTKGTYKIIIADYIDPQCLFVDTNFTIVRAMPFQHLHQDRLSRLSTVYDQIKFSACLPGTGRLQWCRKYFLSKTPEETCINEV